MPLSRFFDLIPEQHLSLIGLKDQAQKTAALESAYADGFTGCFLPDMDGPAGSIARWYDDEFKDLVGKDSYRFEDVNPFIVVANYEVTEYGHIGSKDAMRLFPQQKDPQAVDWLFGIQQNWGDCVDASWVEMLHGLLGVRAANPVNNEVYRWLGAWYGYAFRGYCGHGWYTAKSASVAIEHGYCFALPSVGGVSMLTEQAGETLVAQSWCRSGPPQAVREFVTSSGWRFPAGSISKFSGGREALKEVFRACGQIHHGSNTTSASSTPGRIKRIGGHAQTAFGADWSDATLRFFRDRGVTAFSEDNFPVVNHQTWGGGWSGAVADKYWPEWWGPKPQGAWVCTADQFLSNMSGSAYVYLPKFKGTPGSNPSPPPPSPKVELSGNLQADNRSPIRGTLVAKCGDAETEYIIVPSGDGYTPVPKLF